MILVIHHGDGKPFEIEIPNDIERELEAYVKAVYGGDWQDWFRAVVNGFLHEDVVPPLPKLPKHPTRRTVTHLQAGLPSDPRSMTTTICGVHLHSRILLVERDNGLPTCKRCLSWCRMVDYTGKPREE